MYMHVFTKPDPIVKPEADRPFATHVHVCLTPPSHAVNSAYSNQSVRLPCTCILAESRVTTFSWASPSLCCSRALGEKENSDKHFSTRK